MGAKVTVADLTTLTGSSAVATINSNFDLVADEFDEVLYRDGSQTMQGELDMDSNRIINLPTATTASEPVRLDQLLSTSSSDALASSLASALGATLIGTDNSTTLATRLSRLDTVIGNGTSAITMGAFTGTSIPDSQTIKQSLQALETAVETKAPSAFAHDTSFTAGTVGKKLQQVIDPRDAPYNAAADGSTDDTADIEAAAAAAVSAGAVLRFAPGKTYKFSQITFPAGCVVEMKGATLRSDGSLTTAGDLTVTIEDNCVFDELIITTPGTETNTDILSIGDNVQIGLLDIRADAQRAGGGIITEGDRVRIGRLVTRKIDRPFHINNTSVVSQTEGSWIGEIDVEDYVRCFRADFCSFTVGRMRCSGRSANASKSAGHNGVLILGCANWSMGDLWIEDAGEHAFRIGGSEGTYAVTENYSIGTITAVRPGGCALKINPTLKTTITGTVAVTSGSAALTGTGTTFTTSLRVGDNIRINDTSEIYRVATITNDTTATLDRNVTTTDASSTLDVMEAAHNGTVNRVVGIDVGDPADAGNEELLRLSHVRGLSIGTAEAYADGDTVSSQYLLQINDCSDVAIFELGGETFNAGYISIDGTSDIEASQFGGDVLDLRIGRLFGVMPGNNAIGVNTTFNVGRVHIGLDGIRGFATNVILWSAGTLTDDFELKGWVSGTVAPVYSGVTASDFFLVDVRYDNKRAVGRGASVRGSVTYEIATPTFDSADYNDGANGLFLNNAQGTAGSGSFGSALEFSRLGSSRRAAAIAARQGSADDKEVGLSFFVGDVSTTANEALLESMRLTYERGLAIPDGITAPATMAGWGVIYIDSADGDLKIKFGDGTVKTIVVDT